MTAILAWAETGILSGQREISAMPYIDALRRACLVLMLWEGHADFLRIQWLFVFLS